MELPFVEIARSNIKADRVIVISDNECNTGSTWYTRKTIQALADEARQATGKDFWVHAIDLMGYGTQQFNGPKTNMIAGWSEKVFNFIQIVEQGEGALEKAIDAYQW